MGIFVSLAKTAECVIISLCLACGLSLVSYKPLGILQSCAYSGKSLVSWYKKKSNLAYDRLCLLTLCIALIAAVVALCFSFAGEWASVISLVAFVIFFALYAYADNKKALRTPVVLTSRFKRLAIIYWLVNAIVCYLIVTLLNFVDCVWGNALFSTLKYVVVAVVPMLIPALILLANAVDKVYEIPHNKRYQKKAKAKLAAADIKVVAITGSYGKTSAKNILASLLKLKYKVLSTPSSYNTPMGISRTIMENNLEDYDVFIVEMGARNVGDIAELCSLFPPDYALITGICPQHLESFKTIENIIKTKGEIIQPTKNKVFIAGDVFDLFSAFEGDKVKCDNFAEVVSDSTGTSFTLNLGGKSQKVKVKLLGEHCAQNISICAACAYELGVDFEQIVTAVQNLEFVEHRLQLIKSGGVNIIDDGYNANIKGAEAAINVLLTFSGKRVVVTPGLVELGVLEHDENFALGEKLAKVDFVILVGDTLVGAVKEGYLSAGGDGSKILICSSIFAAQDKLKDIISVGDTVLFLNDLPDFYN
jgi:UDP-N-acetylmuramoyl-tripeptide--D-alanyl-D-alanine ligase